MITLYAVHDGELHAMKAKRGTAGSLILQLPDGSPLDALAPWDFDVRVPRNKAHFDPLAAIAAWEVRLRREIQEHELAAESRRALLSRSLPNLHARAREL